MSGKKARKLQKAANHARQRAIEKAMEQEGEVVMTGKLDGRCLNIFMLTPTDAPKDSKKKSATAADEGKMEVDDL